ncbi:MAG TPA: hypothetical protein VGM88_31660 [Kofleriaceae bacterium]|jgi:D-alanine-D-alanine ligase
MARILVLWNQVDDDVYVHYRRDDRRTVEWNPDLTVEPWETVQEEMDLIVRCLEEGGHEVVLVNIRDSFDTLVAALRESEPDAIMNLVEFFRDDPEQEHHVPGVYEMLGYQYTGSRPLALSMCQKKPHAKALLAAAGLPTPRGIVLDAPLVPADLSLAFPLIVKPAHDDASGGIDSGSVVHDRAALEARVAQLFREGRGSALVEEYIDGREIHCAILGDEALPLYEMQFKGGVDDDGRALPNIITYRAKWDPYSRDHHAVAPRCPVDDLSPAQVAAIQQIALGAYRAVGCRDYARVDMRLSASGQPYILEVNPNPDLADSCAFALCVRASGRTYAQAICQIASYAVERNRLKPARYTGPTDVLLDEYLTRRAGG